MLIYDIGIRLFRLGIRIASHTGNVKARKLNAGLGSTFAILKKKLPEGSRNIWIHAASLGEFEQGRPLIELIRREHPELCIVLTFFSPSGYEIRKNYSGADAIVYLPADLPDNVNRFLDIVRPEMAIFVKYEFWLNYLSEMRRRRIPTYLISGIFRKDQLFFKPYGGFYRNALKAFTHLYVQDEGSVKLLKGIGYSNATAAGDTRFDRVTDIMRGAKPHPLLDRFCGDTAFRNGKTSPTERPLIFMAGSSWPEDEAVYAEWLSKVANVKGVIAPHEFDAGRLAKMKELFKGEAVLMSEAERNPDLLKGKKVLIIDCFGLLASAYSYADIAYVGGGFGAGLHNINEAAVYGIPVIYGPNHNKFIEAIEMKRVGGGIPVSSKEEFERETSALLADNAALCRRGEMAGAYIRSKIGATPRIYTALFPKS